MSNFRPRAFFRQHVLRHSTRQIFTRIYLKKSWANPERVSGNGSDLVQTATIRRELANLIAELNIRALLDAPCGDFNWMRHVPMDLGQYIGADIVPQLIAANAERYAGPNRRFVGLDICRDQPPKVDLILCRDCLVHLPLELGVAALNNFIGSGADYLLTTTYPGLIRANKQLMVTGNWRPLDLCLPPFGLPRPIRVIREHCTEKDDFPEKSLGLWDLRALRSGRIDRPQTAVSTNGEQKLREAAFAARQVFGRSG
jgi:hypothetical protein